MSAGLPQSLAGLLSPRAYPHPAGAVELIETHISWVLLAGEFAYKIKRPVRYAFIDLRDPQDRKHFCEEELRLNRRFAPQLYVEVCEIVGAGGEARIGGRGPVLEHAVRMRRFSRDEELDRLLEGLRIDAPALEAFGRDLALIHARLPAAAGTDAWGRPAEVQGLFARNLAECAEAAALFGTAADILSLRDPLERRLAAAEPWMADRHAGGRVRECHGDLHSRNVVRLGARLVAFDCIEFEPAFRWIDVADEVASLSSDLAARDRLLHAWAFRGGYLAQSGDYPACRLLRLYEAHRALVRAKVAALTAADVAAGAGRESLRHEHLRLVAHAQASLGASRPILLLMHGLSGSGKTWLARPLAQRLAAVHLRSDVERKRRAGLGELARSGSKVGAGLYASRASDEVYGDLARAAEDVILGGYTAVVDATFLRRAQRARFAALAQRLGVPLHLACCEAPPAVLRARVAARGRGGLDPSEADESVLDWQRAHLEAPGPEEGIDVIRIDTAGLGALESILSRVG